MDEGYLRVSEAENAADEILIRFSDQGTHCYLSARKLKKESTLTLGYLHEILDKYKIITGLDQNSLEEICLKVNKGRLVQDALIACSTLPQKGQNGYLDFQIKPFSLKPEYGEEVLGKINFHETHLFENVQPGQIIAYLRPPQPGKDGITVTGEVIPADPVAKFSPQASSGVDWSETANAFIANRMGRVIYKNNTLTVTEEFLVEKDVDFGVGNIDFIGFVHVRGDVLDGFTIHAKKGIHIGGNVGCTQLTSEGDIFLGGMSVRESEGFLTCEGNLDATYLNNVSVQCEGNVHIRKEAINCTIHCNGSIFIEGRIAGGSYVALGGLEAGQIGTEIGVKTKILCGEDFHHLQQVEEIKKQLQLISTRLATLQQVQATLSSQSAVNGLSEEAKRAADKNLSEIQKLQNKKTIFQEGLHCAHRAAQAKANLKINVKKAAHAGTWLSLDSAQIELNESHLGPCSIVPGPDNTMAFQPLTPLSNRIPLQLPDQES